jgi:4-hydroxy-tetrahydrodipicolinate synthase
MNTLSGLFAASVTPMRHNFRCDFEALADHCKDLLVRGCDGVVLFGTTGEGPSFSLSERKEALKKVIELGLDPAKIIVGASFAALDDVIKLSKFACDAGCLALLIAPPFFYKKVSDEGVIAFYRQIILKVKMPIILYHIPQHSGVAITLPVAEALYKEFPETIVGLKESEGNFSFAKELLAKLPGFSLFVGNEAHIREAMLLGAKGTICGLANIYPELILSLFDKNDKSIVELQHILKGYPIFPAIKCLVEKMKGAAFHQMRPPLMALSESDACMLELQILNWSNG